MNYFGVRPYPEKDESYAGYFIRISDLNGLSDLKEFLKVIEVPELANSNIYRWRMERLNKCFESLSLLLMRDEEVIKQAFDQQRNLTWLFKKNRFIQDIRIGNPRICPECISNNGVIDWRWSLAHLSTCPKHNCFLIDTCPCCAKPLQWKSKVLTQCSECDFQWNSHDQPKNALSSLEVEAWEATEKDEHRFSDKLSDICAAIVIMARPYDSYHQSIGSVPYVPNYSYLVNTAYQILQDKVTQRNWALSCFQKRNSLKPLGSDMIFAPIKSLCTQLCTVQLEPTDLDTNIIHIGKETSDIKEYISFIKKSRTKNIPKTDQDLPRYQIQAMQICKILNITSSDFRSIVKSGVLSPIHTTSMTRDQLYDLRDVSTLVESNFHENIDNNWTLITSSSSELKIHFTTYDKLLTSVLEGKTKGTLQKNHIDQISIPKNDLQTWLNEQLFHACHETFSLLQIRKALNCTEEDIRNIISRRTDAKEFTSPQTRYQIIKELQAIKSRVY